MEVKFSHMQCNAIIIVGQKIVSSKWDYRILDMLFYEKLYFLMIPKSAFLEFFPIQTLILPDWTTMHGQTSSYYEQITTYRC